MQFALNENNQRIKPKYSGQIAYCQLCNGKVIGKCGEIYTWHWQHVKDRNCDPWQEHETEWHRNWKFKFPEAWREVIIEENNEKHIADVKTGHGTVIEFQNSPISSETIRTREDFYEDMIWIVNASEFRSNFVIASAVNTGLRNLERTLIAEQDRLEKQSTEELTEIREYIQNKQKKLSGLNNKLEHRKNLLEATHNIENTFNDFAASTIQNWLDGNLVWNDAKTDITRKIKDELKDELRNLNTKIQETNRDIQSCESKTNEINRIETCEVEGVGFKVVDYKKISAKDYCKVRAISKASLATIFPFQGVIVFKNEWEFQKLAAAHASYIFLYDPTDVINDLTKKIEQSKTSLQLYQASIKNLKIEITNQLHDSMLSVMQEYEEEIKIITDQIESLSAHITRSADYENTTKKELDQEFAESKITFENKKFTILREKKGLYSCNWKHERKSWREATCPLYFDIGEDYLFQRLENNLFRKIIITDLLSKWL